mgnify:CR=1 FL=1
MKNKYIIMIYDLCIDILKKEDDKLLLIKENIQSKLSYDNTLSNQIILDDFAKTIYPTFTYYYFQENKTLNSMKNQAKMYIFLKKFANKKSS